MIKEELIKAIREGDVIRYTKDVDGTTTPVVEVVRWKLHQIYRGNSGIKEVFQMDNGDYVSEDEVLELLETNKEYKVYVVCSSYKRCFAQEFYGVLRFDKNNPRIFCKNIAKQPCIELSKLGVTVFLTKEEANNQAQRFNIVRKKLGQVIYEKFLRYIQPFALRTASPYEIINYLEENNG